MTNSVSESNEEMRLQKYLARCGVASRRTSEPLITEGHVTVNGVLVTELGSKVQPGVDVVCVDGEEVRLPSEDVTIMLNKPAGYVTTMSDPQGRPTVASLIPLEQYPSLYPLGRLDYDTTGLLLFSTNGELGNRVLHPRHHVAKTYLAQVRGIPTEDELERLRAGVMIEGTLTQPAQVELLQGDALDEALAEFGFDEKGASGKSGGARKIANKKKGKAPSAVVRITIREGRNKQVRRMCEAVKHPVIALHRSRFGSLALGGLKRGAWRVLSDEEVAALSAEVG